MQKNSWSWCFGVLVLLLSRFAVTTIFLHIYGPQNWKLHVIFPFLSFFFFFNFSSKILWKKKYLPLIFCVVVAFFFQTHSSDWHTCHVGTEIKTSRHVLPPNTLVRLGSRGSHGFLVMLASCMPVYQKLLQAPLWIVLEGRFGHLRGPHTSV